MYFFFFSFWIRDICKPDVNVSQAKQREREREML